MIPVAPGFFKPQLTGGGPPPGDDLTCEDVWGEDFVTMFYDTFSTNGALHGASAEVSPDDSWTYASEDAGTFLEPIRSGGSVSPASFTASGYEVYMVKALISVNMAADETLIMDFPDLETGRTIRVVLRLSEGDDCSFSFIPDMENPTEGTVIDLFSIGASPREVTIGFDATSTWNELTEEYEMFLYVGPDLVTTPAATLSTPISDLFRDGSGYTRLNTFSFANGSDGEGVPTTSVNFIRICGKSVA